MASDETPREIAEALVKTWHELPGSPDVLFTGKELRAAIEAALTAERERAERAERERDGAIVQRDTVAAEGVRVMAERDAAIERAERAERERAELARQVGELVGDDDSDTDHDVEMAEMCDELGRDGMVRAVLRERDTLRERVAVLQAECQAGRELRKQIGWRCTMMIMATGELREPCGADTCTRCAFDAQVVATDAAGAMGEVGRG